MEFRFYIRREKLSFEKKTKKLSSGLLKSSALVLMFGGCAF